MDKEVLKYIRKIKKGIMEKIRSVIEAGDSNIIYKLFSKFFSLL